MTVSDNREADWLSRGASTSLQGLRVLDLTRILAGPYLTMLLGDLGADVIKVEGPTGDDTRHWGPPFVDGEATYFWSANRNKRSLVLDLKSDDGRAKLAELARTADVIVENFRPGVAARLGTSYEDARQLNPRIIYCSISAFGEAEAAKNLAGYDLLVQAYGGLMSITGTEGSGPVKAGVALVDVLAGLHGCVGILAALQHRHSTGQGQRIKVSLLQALLASLANQATAYLGTGRSPGLMGNQHPSIVPYQTFSTADGQIAIACGNDRHFESLCESLDRQDLAGDERYSTNTARVDNRSTLLPTLEESTKKIATQELQEMLTKSGVPAGPVNDIAGAFESARQLGLDPIRRIEREGKTIPQVASPIEMSETPVRYDYAPPAFPQDHA
ncbi:CaiB/BaiF CoA transferase family protein [Ruania albidiflava]|uniref:CaiB/BaiF CoA transferase family protein n=1 Tax=Ruania albidiflava TaxID=366586 RepID=UPI000A056CC7|nr:CoA transferase [Ruania albidiflava]